MMKKEICFFKENISGAQMKRKHRKLIKSKGKTIWGYLYVFLHTDSSSRLAGGVNTCENCVWACQCETCESMIALWCCICTHEIICFQSESPERWGHSLVCCSAVQCPHVCMWFQLWKTTTILVLEKNLQCQIKWHQVWLFSHKLHFFTTV